MAFSASDNNADVPTVLVGSKNGLVLALQYDAEVRCQSPNDLQQQQQQQEDVTGGCDIRGTKQTAAYTAMGTNSCWSAVNISAYVVL